MATRKERRERNQWQAPAVASVVQVLRGHYGGLTLVLIALALSVHAIHNIELRRVVVDVTFCALLLMATRKVGRQLRTATIVLTLPAVIGQWTLRFDDSPLHHGFVLASTTTVLAFLTLVILFNVLRDEAITSDTIVGAVCAYFMLGVTWGTGYAFVEWAAPGSFAVAPALAAVESLRPPIVPLVPLLQYFSFTTLSTLGIGDISPLSHLARTLTVLEGLTGQLYLAVLVARLVGIHTTRAHTR